MHQINILSGNVPPKGGNVYTGEVSMFSSSDDDHNAIQDRLTQDSDIVKEEEDDDEDEDDSLYSRSSLPGTVPRPSTRWLWRESSSAISNCGLNSDANQVWK